MKTKNMKKIVVSTMALVMGAALAGSISGTVAWYQYSTRASVSYVGVSKHSTHALQVSLDGTTWGTSFASADIKAAALAATRTDPEDPLTADATKAHDGENFSPVTPGAANSGTEALGATMYGNPKCGNFAYSLWEAADARAYLQFDLYVRVLDVDGAETPVYLAKNLYLTDFTIETTTTATKIKGSDFANAFRVHVSDQTNYLLLANDEYTTDLHGYLDLDNDGDDDTLADADKNYEWTENANVKQYYGGDSAINQVTKDIADYIADDSGAEIDTSSATKIATTTTGGAKATALKLTFTIWMEGWAELENGVTDNADSSSPYQVWDVAKYVGDLRIGMQFGIENHDFH